MKAVPSRWTPRATPILLIGLIAVAFVLRIYRVEAMSVWTDEGLSIYRARLPLAENLTNRILIQGVATTDTHPPLYFVLLGAWSRLTGETEFALRYLSVIFGTLAVPLSYVAGRRVRDTETGVWLAGLMALSPFYVWHARDARMYTMLAVWTLLSTWLLLYGLQRSPISRGHLALGGFFSLLAVLTHYAGIVLAAFQATFAGVILWRRRPRWALIGWGLTALAGLPAVWFALSRLGFPEFPTFRPFQEMLFETWNVFSLGISLEQIRPIEQLIIFPLLGAIGLTGLLLEGRWRKFVFLLAWMFLPLLAFYLISYAKPAYVNPRNLSPGLPAYLLAIALGLAWLRRRFWPLALIAALIVLVEFGGAIYEQFANPRLMKEDIRSLAKYIQTHQYPGDQIVLHDAIIQLAFDYYYTGGLPVDALPRYGTYQDTRRALEDIEQIASQSDRLWFVDWPAPIGFPSRLLPDWTAEKLFPLQRAGFYGNYTGAHVGLFQTQSPVHDALPPGARAVVADSPFVRWVGASEPAQPIPADQIVTLETYWQRASETLRLTLITELVARDGSVWARSEKALWQYFPLSEWPADKIVQWTTRLRLPIGTPPGDYDVRMRVVKTRSGEIVPLTGADEGGYITSGTLAVSRPDHPWEREDATEGAPIDVNFGERLTLWSAMLPAGANRPGSWVPVDWLWRVDRNLEGTYRYRLDVQRPDGQTFQAHEGELASNTLPSADWQAGDVLRQRATVWLPPDAVEGDYRLRLTLFDSRGDTVTQAVVGALRVEQYPLVTQPPPMQIARRADFDQSIALLGFNLSPEPYTVGRRIDVELIWQTARKPQGDYTVFLHLLDAAGQFAGQGDSDPAGGLRLTSSWRPGEVVVDPHTIWLRADLPPGEYALYAGLYDRESGDRLAVTVDGVMPPERWVRLGTVTLSARQ